MTNKNIEIKEDNGKCILIVQNITTQTDIQQITNALNSKSESTSKTSILNLRNSNITESFLDELLAVLPQQIKRIYLDSHTMELAETIIQKFPDATVIFNKSIYIKNNQLIVFGCTNILYTTVKTQPNILSHIEELHLQKCDIDEYTLEFFIQSIPSLTCITIGKEVTVPENIIEKYSDIVIMFGESILIRKGIISIAPGATQDEIINTLRKHKNLFSQVKKLDLMNSDKSLYELNFITDLLGILTNIQTVIIDKKCIVSSIKVTPQSIITQYQWNQNDTSPSDSSDEEEELEPPNDVNTRLKNTNSFKNSGVQTTV